MSNGVTADAIVSFEEPCSFGTAAKGLKDEAYKLVWMTNDDMEGLWKGGWKI